MLPSTNSQKSFNIPDPEYAGTHVISKKGVAVVGDDLYVPFRSPPASLTRKTSGKDIYEQFKDENNFLSNNNNLNTDKKPYNYYYENNNMIIFPSKSTN